jgi:hypothetical protein
MKWCYEGCERGLGSPRYSRSGDRRYLPAITQSCGRGTGAIETTSEEATLYEQKGGAALPGPPPSLFLKAICFTRRARIQLHRLKAIAGANS